MKNITIVLLLINSLIFSQSAKITYVASLNGYVESLKKNNKNLNNSAIQTIDSDIIFSLFIDTNKSYYKKNESLKTKEKSINMTAIFAGQGIFYYNLNNNKTLNEKRDGLGNFLIEYEKVKWTLTNETKKIGKYTCIKATSSVKRKARNKYIIKEITAWYTPEIPLNFGPKNYNGLPGLILSLQEGRLYLTATKIILNPKEKITIQEPSNKIQKITFQEYEKLLSTSRESYRKRRRR